MSFGGYQFYAQVPACIDASGHRYANSNGTIVCERCGDVRVQKANPLHIGDVPNTPQHNPTYVGDIYYGPYGAGMPPFS